MAIVASALALVLSGAQPVVLTAPQTEPAVAAEPAQPALPVAAPVQPAPAPVETSAQASADPVDPAADVASVPSSVPAEPQAGSAANDIVVTAAPGAPPGDPMQSINAKAFELTQNIDASLVAPIATAYKGVLPKPARNGLHNFIRNLSEPVVAINYLLQLKPGKALKTVIRFGINSTFGIGGLFDVAKDKPFNLPYKHNGFANTLGYYGVKPGPYVFLPLVGPTTLRDTIGGFVDGLLLPVGIGAPFNKLYYSLPNGAIRSLDRRVEFDCQIESYRRSDDPYVAEREGYLRKRQAEIDELHGRGPGPNAAAAQCVNSEKGLGNPPEQPTLPSKPVTSQATEPAAPLQVSPAP